MTFLQLINRVLRELREPQVTDLSATYTLLIGQYINEAKYEVETAWQWSGLRTDIAFTAVVGQKDYLVPGTTERSTLLYDLNGKPLVYDLTHLTQLVEVPDKSMTGLLVNVMPNAYPGTFSQKRSNTGITLRIYPAPDGAYSMQASVYVPQAELTNTTDVLTVPSEPVWRMALASAALERGGGQGDNPARLEQKANRVLADAIVRDTDDVDLTLVPR